MKNLIIIIIIFAFAIQVKSQFVEDALRLSNTNGIITPRAAGLNVSYYGISDDIAALHYNPAGLTLLAKQELSFGLGFAVNSVNAQFQGIENEISRNNSYISHVGLAAPFQMEDTKAAIGIGYFYEDAFDNTHEYSAFNATNTSILSETKNGPLSTSENWAYALYLNDPVVNDLGQITDFNTPYADSMQQSSFVLEEGGLHNVVGGVAFDLNEYVAIGFSLIGKWGTYSYERELIETDPNGVYNNTSIEGRTLSRLTTRENITSDIAGISGSLGLQARLFSFMRFGVGVKFPTYYEIEELFDKRVDADYTNAQSEFYAWDGENSYNLNTPFIYSAGVSVHGMGLTFTAGVEYNDATQLEFTDAITQVDQINLQIIRELVGQTKWGFGLEYDIPLLPIAARASYERITSPYADDIPNSNLSNFSLGGSIYLGKHIRLDGVFRWTDISEQRTQYGSSSREETLSNYVINPMPLNIALGFTYRF